VDETDVEDRLWRFWGVMRRVMCKWMTAEGTTLTELIYLQQWPSMGSRWRVSFAQ